MKISQTILLLTLIPALSCKITPDQLAQALNERSEPRFSDTQILPVYIATNRKTQGAARCGDGYFGTALGSQTNYGVCEIGVPKKHSVGALDQSDDRDPDPSTYFVTGKWRQFSESELGQALNGQKEILVFVHGFNVKFEEAALRAAQMKYDLKFPGAVVLFTWPAGADESFFESLRISNTYEGNLRQARASRAAFSSLIQQISGTGARVNVIAHSMGHQVVLPGLAAASGVKLNELILNAPDFATQEFKELAPTLTRMARRITLYCSPGDNALVASEKVNNTQRIGRCSRVSGVDVINVNEVDAPALGLAGLGHGYYSGRSILTDVYQVLLGMDARNRLFIRVSSEGGGEDYVLRR
ncbi:MAG: alpha/beta hydrolase [Leptospirales bacterium]|nr:alpha/beta hydrolase [Leptospirales bacterium]